MQPCKKRLINIIRYAHLQCNRINLLNVTALMSSLSNKTLLQFEHMKMSTTVYKNVYKLHCLL